MTHAEVQAWLDRYVEAWTSYDESAIGALFAEDAEYRYQPWGEPTVGRAAILHDWLNPGGSSDKRDEPGTSRVEAGPDGFSQPSTIVSRPRSGSSHG